MQYWIVHADAPSFCAQVIHSLTCCGMMSIIRIDPKYGRRYAFRQDVYFSRVVSSTW
ncbi:MAG TPA: hypothetical protein VKU39_22415 [Streptosporangiaceae bacterium]|nr:hypothetical protein [Streptosporangiaceae bacterium]